MKNQYFQLKRLIKRILLRLQVIPSQYWSSLEGKFNYFILTLKSLFYNEFLSFSYFMEVLLGPMFWLVDHFSLFLGPILVFAVVSLTSIIVGVVYVIGLPYYWDNYPNLTVILMIYGHWLLINVVFNYYMAYKTSPGTPPEGILISEAVSVCKKCIAPKPPRTHHCSVCNVCVLKMDHHCPWLDSCVGHYNHRYFYMYMVYMVLGTSFIMMLGFEIFYHEIWLGGDRGTGWQAAFYHYLGWEEAPYEHKHDWDLHSGFPGRMNGTHFIPSFEGTTGRPELIEEHPDDSDTDSTTFWYRFFIMFTAMLTTGAFISLLTLVIWHGRLISNGETSIEAHINKKERERLKKVSKVYTNPYNYGRKQNWKIFLGLHRRRGLRSILLPSTHPPAGNGLSWPSPSLVNSHDKVV